MAVPYTFGSATTSIPLSQLDSNFATTITLGNTAIQLGNTVTTLNNMTLGNVTVSSGNVVAGIASGAITQSMLGTNVAGNGPAFSAYANANQNVTSATWTKVQINTEFFDTNSNYDNATNYRFTPTVAGYYQVNFGICFNSSATNPTVIGATLYKNSVQTYGGNQAANPVATALTSFSYVIYMNGSTDYLEVYGYASGGSGTLFFQGQSTAGSAYVASYFNASLVRAS